MSRAYTIGFQDLRVTDRPQVGGKCASLGEMVSAGLPVPSGFAVTVDAFDQFRHEHDLWPTLQQIVGSAQGAGAQELQKAHDQAVELIMDHPMPEDVDAPIRAAYLELSERVQGLRGLGPKDPDFHRLPVAVRSSSVDEDGDTASFAGQQETYLWVRGVEELERHVKECWASLYTPQAIAYRSGLTPEQREQVSQISVAVQLMAEAAVAGVTFTVSPRTGDRSVMAINASYGLGEAVVSGEVTPDEFWLNKVGPTITTRRIATKLHRCEPSPSGQGVRMVDVPEDLQTVACLTDDEVLELARVAQQVEDHYKAPQDIEWGLERHPDGTHKVLLLQARPETTWKKRKAEAAEKVKQASPSTGLLGLITKAAEGAKK